MAAVKDRVAMARSSSRPRSFAGSIAPTAVTGYTVVTSVDRRDWGQARADALGAEWPGVPVLLAGGQVDRVVEPWHPVEAVESRRRPPRAVQVAERPQ